MSWIISELKERIKQEFPKSEGVQLKVYYRFKEKQNFVEIYGNDEENIKIKVQEKSLNEQLQNKCSLENSNRSLKAVYWIKDFNSIDQAMELIRRSHSYIQKNRYRL